LNTLALSLLIHLWYHRMELEFRRLDQSWNRISRQQFVSSPRKKAVRRERARLSETRRQKDPRKLVFLAFINKLLRLRQKSDYRFGYSKSICLPIWTRCLAATSPSPPLFPGPAFSAHYLIYSTDETLVTKEIPYMNFTYNKNTSMRCCPGWTNCDSLKKRINIGWKKNCGILFYAQCKFTICFTADSRDLIWVQKMNF